jgi:hypothetical protein
VSTVPAFVLCTVWGMAPMLDLAVLDRRHACLPIRQVLTPSFSDVSARPTPARWRMRAGMDELRRPGARMTTSPVPVQIPAASSLIRSSVPPC